MYVVVHNVSESPLPIDEEGHQCYPAEFAVANIDFIGGRYSANQLNIIDSSKLTGDSDSAARMCSQEAERLNTIDSPDEDETQDHGPEQDESEQPAGRKTRKK